MSLQLLCSTAIKSLKDNHIGKYDQNEEYIFTNKMYLIPNVLRPKFGLKKIRRDRRKKRYGRIKGHVFNYITAPMVLITCGLVYIVSQNISTLLVFFNTNVYLNGLIVSLMIFGVLRVFFNSYLLFRAASFMRDLERVGSKENVAERDIYKLRSALEKKGELLNTIYMSEVITHIEEKGYLNITDNQARFIKSKLGFRASRNRQGVNFISGILVMLGLLGTFLGLLATIDSVGSALNSMANLGGDDGDIGMEQMTQFISSLAAPLQGMGLAFSSSLFGLSGSLLIGFYLHLSGTPQNFFIENVSRWIDENIKRFHPKDLAKRASEEKSVEKVKAEQVRATDQDLKDWLTGYVYLASQTHQKITTLTDTIANQGDGIRTDVQHAASCLHDILEEQKDLGAKVVDLSKYSSLTAENLGQIQVSIKDMQDLSHVMNTSLTSIDVASNKMSGEMVGVSQSVHNMQALLEKSQDEIRHNSAEIVGSMNLLAAETSKSALAGHETRDSLQETRALLDNMKGDMRKYSSALYQELKKSNEIQNNDGERFEFFVQRLMEIEKHLGKVEEHQQVMRSYNTSQGAVISELLEALSEDKKKIEDLTSFVKQIRRVDSKPLSKKKRLISFLKRNDEFVVTEEDDEQDHQRKGEM